MPGTRENTELGDSGPNIEGNPQFEDDESTIKKIVALALIGPLFALPMLLGVSAVIEKSVYLIRRYPDRCIEFCSSILAAAAAFCIPNWIMKKIDKADLLLTDPLKTLSLMAARERVLLLLPIKFLAQQGLDPI